MNVLKRIKRIGHDIHTGQNIDVYIAIVVSIIIAILGILGVVNQTVIFSALLTVTAIVTYSMLVNRQQNEEVMAVLSNLKDTRSLAARFFHKEDDIGDIIKIIRKSQEVILWGYTLSSHIPLLKEDIEDGLDRGMQVKILLLKPLSKDPLEEEASAKALHMAAVRSESLTSIEVLNKNLVDNLTILKRIKSSRPNLEYKVIDYFAPYTMYVYDPSPQLSSGKIMVRLSTLEVRNADRPTYYLTATDDKPWFDFHYEQFKIAWGKAEEWVGDS
jgi:hypothetical protein